MHSYYCYCHHRPHTGCIRSVVAKPPQWHSSSGQSSRSWFFSGTEHSGKSTLFILTWLTHIFALPMWKSRCYVSRYFSLFYSCSLLQQDLFAVLIEQWVKAVSVCNPGSRPSYCPLSPGPGNLLLLLQHRPQGEQRCYKGSPRLSRFC